MNTLALEPLFLQRKTNELRNPARSIAVWLIDDFGIIGEEKGEDAKETRAREERVEREVVDYRKLCRNEGENGNGRSRSD